MNVIIDVILCAIVVIGCIIGFKVGFVSLVAKPVKAVLAIIFAFVFCTGVADAVMTPMISTPVTNYLVDFMNEKCAGITAENYAEELPTLLKLAASVFGIDLSETVAGTSGSVLEGLVETLTAPVINVVSIIISFVVVWIVSKILLSLIFFLINALLKGPLGALNGILGCIVSTILAIVIAWGVAVLLEFVFHTAAFEGNALIEEFEGGFFYRFFNTYSPLELLLSF